MAELYQVTVPAIARHVRRIYEERELAPEATINDFLIVAQEGDRSVERRVSQYRLALALAIGYRVRSERAMQFRRWATEILVQEAIAFLRRTSLPIERRKKWPTGGLPQYRLNGQIPRALQAQEGKALCVWGDAGWGNLVRRGKYHDHHFADDLVAACAAMFQAWNPMPVPTWVTCVPSLRHPDLVPNFAQRLATALGLPFHAVIVKTDNRPEQKTMANSVKQARNVDGSLALSVAAIPPGPVLLVDDRVDSRWTLTVAAWLLRSNGSGEVWPLALSETGGGE